MQNEDLKRRVLSFRGAAVHDCRRNPPGKRISHFSASIFLTSEQETVRKMESEKCIEEQVKACWV
jgi:hypothetical protein